MIWISKRAPQKSRNGNFDWSFVRLGWRWLVFLVEGVPVPVPVPVPYVLIPLSWIVMMRILQYYYGKYDESLFNSAVKLKSKLNTLQGIMLIGWAIYQYSCISNKFQHSPSLRIVCYKHILLVCRKLEPKYFNFYVIACSFVSINKYIRMIHALIYS